MLHNQIIIKVAKPLKFYFTGCFQYEFMFRLNGPPFDVYKFTMIVPKKGKPPFYLGEEKKLFFSTSLILSSVF